MLYLCEADVVSYIREEHQFPGVQQAAVLQKTECRNGVNTVEVWCLLSSASATMLPPKAFLKTIQTHWQIENGLHFVKDTLLKEDAHYTTSTQQAMNLTIFRNVTVSVLNLLTPPHKRTKSRPVECKEYGAKPLDLLETLKTKLPKTL